MKAMQRIMFLSACTLVMVFTGCKKDSGTDPGPSLEPNPLVSLSGLTDITETSALVLCNVSENNGLDILDRGICYSRDPAPTLSDGVIYGGFGEGSFSGTLPGLNPGTRYYVRVYAETANGVFYSTETSFKTQEHKIIVSITNMKLHSGDQPAVSAFYSGANSQILHYGNTLKFELNETPNTYLYVWTCNPLPCVWYAYLVPVQAGVTVYYSIPECNRYIAITRETQ